MEKQGRGAVTASVSVAAVVFLLYLPALFCDFVHWDDLDYILNNNALKETGRNLIAWAFTSFSPGFWMPLTWISFAVDYHFWGLNPFGYHLANILLHALNAGLVALVADRIIQIQGSRFAIQGGYLRLVVPFMAGLLWGIHPLRVESVAWVAERKDVLNGLFSLGAVLHYLKYVQKRDSERKAGRDYLISVALFAASLMAKPVSVVIPAILLVLDRYPLERFRKGEILPVLTEKAPYLVMSAAMSCATLYFAARAQILVSTETLPLGMRTIIAGNALFEYCRLQLWPLGISPLYLIPGQLPVSYVLKTLISLVVTCYCLYVFNRKPWITATWCCFLLPILPVLGFVQNGDQSLAVRFTYLPSVAIAIAAAFLAAGTYSRFAGGGRSWRITCIVIAWALLCGYAGITVRLIGVWKDTETLWTRVIETQPMGRAFQERGIFRFSTGKYLDAVEDFSTAMAVREGAGMPVAYNLIAFRGAALAKLGRHDEALRDFSEAIAIAPHPNYFYHRGVVLKGLGRTREAEEDFARAGNERGPISWY